MITKNTFPEKKELNKNEETLNIKVFNYGLALLKSILAFYVVITHNFKRNSTNNKIILSLTSFKIPHVPAFFIMSFYFTKNNLLSSNLKLFFNRLERLLIPYIIWPIIIWIINKICNYKYEGIFPVSFVILKLQLLYGSSYMTQFWFQWNLIVIYILFFLIIFIFRRQSLFILHLLLIVIYASQYSGFSYKKFYLPFPYYNKYTFSRIFGMIPLGVTGFSLGFYKIINSLQKYKLKVLLYSLSIYKTVSDYYIFRNPGGKQYYGVHINIKAVCIIFIFSLFPSDKIRNKYIKNILIYLTNYSAGVFYLHISIRNFFKFFIYDIKKGSFFGLLINYLICYCICEFGMKIFGKTRFKYLFC